MRRKRWSNIIDTTDMSRCISNENKRFADYLSSHLIKTEFEYRIGNKSYDLKVERKNILIEIDPTYTHNATNRVLLKGQPRGRPKTKNYHYNKTKTALENGFICIHKFDWVSDNDILRIIRNIHKYDFIQESPKLHWYHPLFKDHIEDFDEKLSNKNMVASGYVEIWDDGVTITKL